LLENEQAHGAYNLTAPNPVTNGIFTQLLADTLKRPAVVPAPKFALRMALGEMADALLLSSCRALPTRLTEQEFQFQHSDLADCLTAILAPSQ
jgi:NAD dependent epimerase/dehydratase family enzyme